LSAFVLEWWPVLGLAATLALLVWYTVRRVRAEAGWMLESAPPARVSVDDRGLTLTMGSAPPSSLPWSRVHSVTLHTTGQGPLAEDVFWELEGPDGTVAVPNGAEGILELFDAAGRHLPGFDHEAVIAAMGSMREARFLVWRRSGG
jgi:hypothetical protein